MKVKSVVPISYAGGKAKVVKRILSPLFPTEFEDFYEPFIGGGSVSLFMSQLYPEKKFFVNDINDKLIMFWNALQNDIDEVMQILHNVRDAHNPDDSVSFNSHLRDIDKRPAKLKKSDV